MTKYLITIVTVGAILFLGMSIDIQSRTAPVRNARADEVVGYLRLRSRRGGDGRRSISARNFTEAWLNWPSASRQRSPQEMCCYASTIANIAMTVALARADLHMAEAKLQRLINGARSEERREAEALWKAKSADLERARLQWNRVRQLRAQSAVTEQEADNQRMEVSSLEAAMDAARARYELLQASARPDEVLMAEAAIAAAQAKLEVAQLQLSRTQLTSPVAGHDPVDQHESR